MTTEQGKIGRIERFLNYVLVAAIDVGTSNSGYAFSFKTDPEVIRMNKNWGESESCSSYKTPTCILTENGTQGGYVNFGYDAANTYKNALVGEEKNRYDFYYDFKMLLYTEKNLTNRTTVTSDKGTRRPLMEIFTMIIEALKDHLLQALDKTKIRSDDIRWVITVPAIWSDKAKQFMLNSAEKAGLHPSTMILTLEPEAASLHCRGCSFNHFVRATELYFEDTDLNFTPGKKYLVIDAGGGTVDITAHEILEDGSISELTAATGGHWGGSTINDNFIALLISIMGSEFIERFKKECPLQWYNVNMEFESKKRSARPDCSLNIPLSAALERNYRKWTNKELDETINSKTDLGVSESNAILILSTDAVRNLFQPVISRVISHITSIMESSEKLQDIDYLFLVGGFGACKHLQNALQDYFKGKQPVLIPFDAQTAVICGAIKYGHNPSLIKAVKAQRTYGVSTMIPFDKKVHRAEKMVEFDGTRYCKDIFLPFINKGDNVDINQSGKTCVSPASESITTVNVTFHSLERSIAADEVLDLDSPGVELLTNINVNIPKAENGEERVTELEIIFSSRKIYAKTHNLSTGVLNSVEIDFMTI